MGQGIFIRGIRLMKSAKEMSEELEYTAGERKKW